MAFSPGSSLGVYTVTALIGEGGMGQVYRATDTKLKRQVAIKILPPALAADHDRLARFQREAEVLASLNHPNIAAIHGVEESGGMTALVMELVEGDDLSQRIARGAIPLEDALPIAKQIAEALEAAHEQGIIHRDLKPANIKVRADGTVKTLDFGLAKAMEPVGAAAVGASMSPTLSLHATQTGMILGTAAYMSPEQARGKTVDKRADIWAFGCVLFEMLAGDATRLELRGQAFLVEGGVGRSSTGGGSFTVSGTGTLAYAGTLSTPGRLTWFDRGGNPSDSAASLGDYTDFRLSPDQTRLAASLVDPKTGFPDIWITDLTRGGSAPFTFGPALNASPVWAIDGARIIFRTTRTGGLGEFYAKSAGGGGKEEPVLSQTVARASGVLATNIIPWDWSSDGRYLLFSTTTAADPDLWLMPLTGEPKPMPFLSAPGDQFHGNFSPDGRLIAYTSNESGRFEVYVQTFPLTDRRWTVSTTGGYEPRWRADGREIYYLSADQKFMAVGVGPGPSFGAPTELFQVRVAGGVSSQRTHYVPSRDGRRFLINTSTGDAASTVPITVVLNWTAGLK